MKFGWKQILTLNRVGAITDIDAEFCRFLLKLHPDIDESVVLAACLTSMGYRNGDVCLNMDAYAGQTVFDGQVEGAEAVTAPEANSWKTALKASDAVGRPGDFTPLILDDVNRLYFHKLWTYEKDLAAQILARAAQQYRNVDEALLKSGLNRLFKNGQDDENTDWQQVGAVAAIYNRLTVISGGPGTGKTTTVARILALIMEQAVQRNEQPAIALAAPTGKAATRLEESIANARLSLNINYEIKTAMPAQAVTIDQLLGARRHSSAFRYNSENPLPYNVVIVDEASMIDQALMSKLMGALLEKAQIILLGDKDQLASVEAGSVLGDICGHNFKNSISSAMMDRLTQLGVGMDNNCVRDDSATLTDNIILLNKSYRFEQSSGIGTLSQSINAGDAARVLDILNDKKFPDASLREVENFSEFEAVLTEKNASRFRAVLEAKTPQQKFECYTRFCLLAAHRTGPWGVDYINQRIERSLQKRGLIPSHQQWYPGKPVIINRNDYTLGLSNGDLGICMRSDDGNLKIFFRVDEMFMDVWPSRLPDHSPAYSLTVHKSQGSEFDDIMLVLPDSVSKVLSRELVYTAVTRARATVEIIGKPTVLAGAINRTVARNSGLKERLWNA